MDIIQAITSVQLSGRRKIKRRRSPAMKEKRSCEEKFGFTAEESQQAQVSLDN